MNLNDYRLNAYKKANDLKNNEKSSEKKQIKKESNLDVVSISKSKSNVAKNHITPNSKKTKNFEPDPELKAATDALTRGGLVKVPVSDEQKESVYRRVAKFLILIGVDRASEVLKYLTQEETEKIIPEITSIRKIDSDEALLILEEFNDIIEKVKTSGGTKTAQTILEKAFGKDRAQDLLDRLNLEKEQIPFEYLNDKEPEKVFELLKEESNQARAIVLSFVPPKNAAKVINMLSASDKKEVILHLAKTKKVMPEVINRIDKVIHEKSLKQTTVKTNTIDGKSVLAEILKKMDYKSEQDIIETLSYSDPTLVDDLRSRLFTQEDVLNSDDRFLQQYLRELSDIDIAFLIGDKDEPFREKILSNMSSTRSQMILEEENIRKPMHKKDCIEITQKFYLHLRRAFENGNLFVEGRDGQEYIE